MGVTRSKVIWRVSCFIGNYEVCPVQAMQFGYSWCQWPHPYLQGIPSYRVEMSVTHTPQVSHKEFSYVFVASRRFTLKSRQELTHQIFCWSPLQCFLWIFVGPDLDLEALRVPRRQQRLISGPNALEDSQCNSDHGKVCPAGSSEWPFWVF